MYNITQQGDSVQYGVIECICDTRADIQNLPTDWQAGSSCLVIADSSVWMLNNQGVWQEL